jgi:hypothetical protein
MSWKRGCGVKRDSRIGLGDSWFGLVSVIENMAVLMMDGKWYTQAKLVRRLGVHRGLVGRSLANLRAKGYIQRAKNPRNTGRPWHRDEVGAFVYRWVVGKVYQDNYFGTRPDRKELVLRNYVFRHLPATWRRIIL